MKTLLGIIVIIGLAAFPSLTKAQTGGGATETYYSCNDGNDQNRALIEARAIAAEFESSYPGTSSYISAQQTDFIGQTAYPSGLPFWTYYEQYGATAYNQTVCYWLIQINQSGTCFNVSGTPVPANYTGNDPTLWTNNCTVQPTIVPSYCSFNPSGAGCPTQVAQSQDSDQNQCALGVGGYDHEGNPCCRGAYFQSCIAN